MSDDNNQNTLAFQLQGLARQLDEIRQQLQQQSQPTPTVTPSHMEADDDYDPQIIERSVASDLIPTEQLQRALPGMADDFFAHLWTNLIESVLNLAENVGRFTKHHDGQLSEIQRCLAATTCPMDKFLHESLRSNAPSIPIEEVIYFMNTMHTLVSDTASHITQLRMDNVSRETRLVAPPIQPKTKLTPSTTPLFQDTKAIADSTNLRKAVQAVSRKPQRRQFNCSHSQQPRSTRHRNQQPSGAYDSTFQVGHSSSNTPGHSQPAIIGGCLSSFSSAWSKLSAEKWVQSVIEKGYRIPFSTPPPTSATYQSQHLPHLRVPQLSLQQRTTVEAEVHALLVKQAIEKVLPENQNDQLGFHSTLFTILKKTGGETSGPQSEAIKSVSSSHTVQDGNHKDYIQSSSEGILHDKYRFDRCFSPCISSRNIQKVSTVSLESQGFSISHHPFLTFSEPYGVHQDIEIEGNLQIRDIRVPRESKEITAKSVYNHSVSRLSDQHRDDDINGTHQQDTRHWQVSPEIITPNQVFPRETAHSATSPTGKSVKKIESTTRYVDRTCQMESSMVDTKFDTMEWTHFYSRSPSPRTVHRCIHDRSGNIRWFQRHQRFVVAKREVTAYKLSRAYGHIFNRHQSKISRPLYSNLLQQLHRRLLRRSFWPNQITASFGSHSKNMEQLLNEQYTNKGGLYNNDVQPGQFTVPTTIGSTTEIESRPENILSTGTTMGSAFSRSIYSTAEHQMPPVM
ncbi:hypothetical protein INT48_007054 [Thamnidium elegans]|uniref:Uncharacterized protein n=1 Tax=Thamnidium elegans TaxID=101142 RepID=A0A8H7SG91_9FUNG|nr:hypothetical protein INT48_007054 [Thamnidium elegans]